MIICKGCYECVHFSKDCKGVAVMNPKLGKPCGRYKLTGDDDPETQGNNSAPDDPQDESEPDTDTEPMALPVSNNDPRHTNFVRLASKRVNKVLDNIRLLGNLTSNNYKSSDTERKFLKDKIQAALNDLFEQ